MPWADMKQRDQKAVNALERARAIWTLSLRGLSPSEMTDAIGERITAADIKSANALVGAAWISELEVETIRGIEAAKLDQMQQAIWDRAMGRPFETIIQSLLDEGGDYDGDQVKIVRRIIEDTKDDQVTCIRTLLAISERRGKMLAIDAQQPSINAVIMPTVHFNVPRPGERDLEANGITIAAEPVDPASL